MSTEDLDEFAYLWDGSQPGWELHWTNHLVWRVTVHLTGGSSPGEVSRLRKLIPELGAMSALHAYRAVQGQTSIPYPGELGNIEKGSVLRRAEELGLRVTAEVRDCSGGVPYRDGFVLHIEDEDLVRRVCDKMRASGCRVQLEEAD